MRKKILSGIDAIAETYRAVVKDWGAWIQLMALPLFCIVAVLGLSGGIYGIEYGLEDLNLLLTGMPPVTEGSDLTLILSGAVALLSVLFFIMMTVNMYRYGILKEHKESWMTLRFDSPVWMFLLYGVIYMVLMFAFRMIPDVYVMIAGDPSIPPAQQISYAFFLLFVLIQSPELLDKVLEADGAGGLMYFMSLPVLQVVVFALQIYIGYRLLLMWPSLAVGEKNAARHAWCLGKGRVLYFLFTVLAISLIALAVGVLLFIPFAILGLVLSLGFLAHSVLGTTLVFLTVVAFVVTWAFSMFAASAKLVSVFYMESSKSK